MDTLKYNFSNVSLLITHYNRSSSLEKLLSTFKNLHCFFREIVVSDDGSRPEHLAHLKQIKQFYDFKLILSEVNKGLGNNLNKGQDAITSEFTLYVQEDFIPTVEFAPNFKNALAMMSSNKELDVVRFYAYVKYPYLKPYKDGFSKMVIKPWYTDYMKIYYYSDHPHLRRSNFLNKFGRYAENVKGDRMEYRMCVSFIQSQGKGLFFDNFKSLFIQENSEIEPSTMSRKNWTQTKNPVISMVRYVYRQLKYNYDIWLYKRN